MFHGIFLLKEELLYLFYKGFSVKSKNAGKDTQLCFVHWL